MKSRGRPKGTKNKWHWRSPLEERFWEKVDKKGENECWNWLAFVHPTGYGKIAINRKMYHAHRISWELTNGKIPEGMFVLHKCDNRKCVNPDHLFLGSNKDNMKDMVNKGRGKHPDNRGERHGLHKLTEENVRKIREIYKTKVYTQEEIGNMFGIKRQQVSTIILRKTWGWLED
jgi:hypothetical protein